MRTIIKQGCVLRPDIGEASICDIALEGETIAEIAPHIENGERVIDASGCLVFPGFIDLHVHLRDPGLTYKETLETGAKAAAKGGVTTMCAMPNTKPPVDTEKKVVQIHERAKGLPTEILQLGAVTMGQEGYETADIKGMASAGCVGISEDGKSVMDAELYKSAMTEAKENHMIVFAHCEDIDLVNGGVLNAGKKAEALGLPGICNAAEDVITARDIALAAETGVQLHLCHCSTAQSVDLLRQGKAQGISVSGEVCPHHFTLTEEDICEDHGRFKMNPPLRTEADKMALIQGLRDGTVEAIATDHAPHSKEEKEKPIRDAAFGIVGLETLASLTYTELVVPGHLTALEMADRLSTGPARILGLSDRGKIEPGALADLVIFDPRVHTKINRDSFVSMGKNTPFHGKEVQGEVSWTVKRGKIVYSSKGESL